jgi:hypothetical protein
MTSIVQVEYRLSLLSIRQEILESLGHPVISVVGSRAARNLDLTNRSPGVIVIGHGASRQKRQGLINYFRQAMPGVPIVASLLRRDKDVSGADYNCPADNPPLWVRTVRQALAGIGSEVFRTRLGSQLSNEAVKVPQVCRKMCRTLRADARQYGLFRYLGKVLPCGLGCGQVIDFRW